jgi:hypothetical protein
MMNESQIEKYLPLAELLLILGIIGIFAGSLFNITLLMNVSLGLDLTVGLMFLTSINLPKMKAMLENLKTIENIESKETNKVLPE